MLIVKCIFINNQLNNTSKLTILVKDQYNKHNYAEKYSKRVDRIKAYWCRLYLLMGITIFYIYWHISPSNGTKQ